MEALTAEAFFSPGFYKKPIVYKSIGTSIYYFFGDDKILKMKRFYMYDPASDKINTIPDADDTENLKELFTFEKEINETLTANADSKDFVLNLTNYILLNPPTKTPTGLLIYAYPTKFHDIKYLGFSDKQDYKETNFIKHFSNLDAEQLEILVFGPWRALLTIHDQNIIHNNINAETLVFKENDNKIVGTMLIDFEKSLLLNEMGMTEEIVGLSEKSKNETSILYKYSKLDDVIALKQTLQNFIKSVFYYISSGDILTGTKADKINNYIEQQYKYFSTKYSKNNAAKVGLVKYNSEIAKLVAHFKENIRKYNFDRPGLE